MLNENKLIEEANNAINWIKDYVEKSGAKGVVVGNSGGKDSATVLAMAVKSLGKENVLAVSMPCGSINTDFEDAKLVAETFGVRFIKVELKTTFNELETNINIALEKNITDEAKINVKPRLRMTTLYAVAQSLGYLVIGTGNLSEAMVRLYN